MKKNLFKKSMALLMTVMMLMTCWVFVAPEHSHAADYKETSSNYTITFNITVDNATPNGGDIQIKYLPWKSDGSGFESTEKVYAGSKSSQLNSMFSDGDPTGNYTVSDIPGFPTYIKVTVKAKTGDDYVVYVTASFYGTQIFNSGKLADAWYNDKTSTAEAKYGASGWTTPYEATITGLEDHTLTLSATGDVSVSDEAVIKDQYGVAWNWSPKYTLTNSTGATPTGVTFTETSNTDGTHSGYTISAGIGAIWDSTNNTAVNGYNTGTGEAKLTLKAAANSGNVSQSKTITLKAPSYQVTFKNWDGTVLKTQSVYYGGSATAPSASRAYDEKYHYIFTGWSADISKVTGNIDPTAQYTAEAHNHNGAYTCNKTGLIHARACSCGSVGWNGTDGLYVPCDVPWGGTNDYHTGICNDCQTDLGHTPVPVEVVDIKYRASEATCTEPAKYYKSCSVCGQAITNLPTFSVGEAKGHSWVADPARHVAATCTAPGYDIMVCQNADCGAVDPTPVYKDANGNYLYPASHTWNQGRALDKNDGTHGYQCTVCFVWDETTLQKHGYNQAGPVFRADCTRDGVYNYLCGDCGSKTTSKYVFNNETREFTTELVDPALGHNWVKLVDADHPDIPATCTTEGSYYERCTRSGCGVVEERVYLIDPDAHHYLDAVPNDDDTHTAECEYCHKTVTGNCKDNDANKDCVCDVCKDAIAHDYQNKVDAKYLVSAADCNSYAVYYKSCAVCGVASTETFEDVAAGYGAHDWKETKTFIKSVAKCETDAVYYYECLECGMSSENFDGSTWTDKGSGYAHVFRGAIVNNNNGTHSYTCINVDASGIACTAEGGTVNCNYGAWDTTNASGHSATCKDCGYTTPVEAHNWGEGWKPAAGNTDNAKGQMTRTCTVCSRTETTDCQYGKGVEFEANCMHDKYTEYTCADCGHGYTVIEAGTKLPHSYTGDYEIDAENDKHRQLCVNGCNEYNPEWTACTLVYSQVTGTETHSATCPACGNIDTGDCFGGTATCINKAKCDKCGGEHGDYAPHNFAGAVRNEGTGKHSYNCTTDGCGEYGVGTTVGATEDCFGGTAYCDALKICSACNTAYGELDPNNHRYTTAQPGLAPTCMTEGYTDYETCDHCGTEIGKEVIPVDPNAHNWSNEAVSTDDGKHYYACVNKDAEGNVCTAKDVYECVCSDPTILPPTCEKGGYTEHYCDDANCNYYWTTDPTEPIGHDYGEWITNEDKTGHYQVCKNDPTHIVTGVCAESVTTVTTAPTCTEQGYTTYTCTVCGNTWDADFVDATGHHYTQKIIDDAHLFTAEDYEACGITSNTCVRADYYWFDCKDCDKNGKSEEDAAKYPLNTRYYENGKGEGHKFTGKSYNEDIADKLILKSEATCTDHEVYYTYCTECYLSTKGIEGKEATFTRWGTAISHDYQEIVNENDLAKNRVSVATCTAKAKYYKSCANCGDVDTDATFTYGEMTAHSYTEKLSDYAHIITSANCATVATYWYDCATCNSNAKLADTTDMTEEEIAVLQYTFGTVDKNNHGKLVKVAYKAPTCMEAGHSEYKVCTLCNTEIGKVTAGYEMKAHSFKGEFRVVNEVDGSGNIIAYKHQRACEYGCGEYSAVTTCGFSAWSQNADGKTHSMACICGNKITADCVANSNSSCESAATCKDCGGVLSGTALGHDWGEWKSNNDGKTHSRVCKTNSKHVETKACGGGVVSGCGAIYCSTCNQQYATGVDHDWGDWSTIKAATCTTLAVRKRACKAAGCGAVEEETFGTVLGHDYDTDNDGINDGVVTKDATCTASGIKTYTCANNCGTTYTEVIKALGHELAKDWTITLEATCSTEGTKIKKCVHSWKDADGNVVECDYYEESTIAANGNHKGEWVDGDVEVDCATGGMRYEYCTVCGKLMDSKPTDPAPHTWVADAIVYGTCDKNGYINMVCSKCGSKMTFNETVSGFPNKCETIDIDEDTAKAISSKGGHSWEAATADGEGYVAQNGCKIYVTKAASCKAYGSGYMVCTADNCGATKTVSINKLDHNLKTMPASEATCQTPGHTEYLACRNCSYTTEPTTIPKLGHVDTDASGKCDRCGFEMYVNDNGNTAACGCMCHNSNPFIKNFIYPIAKFFWKIFGMNKSCSCKTEHY